MNLRTGTSGRPRERGEAGVSTVEVVIITPVMLTFVLLLVAMGFYVENIGKVQSAAQDAARMASLQRGAQQQKSQAASVAWNDLGSTCNRDTQQTMQTTGLTVTRTNLAVPGNPDTVPSLEITVTCDISVFGATYTVTESSYAPLNVYSGQQ